jgi:hypothetical protein
LAAETLLADLYELPTRLSFDAVSFGDHGLNLTAEYLIRHGYRPGLDFNYPYGALSLLFSEAWFRSFGATPASWYAAIVVCDLAFAAGLARFATQLRLRRAGIALILAGLPFSVFITISFAHALERTLLCWGLAEQARGKQATALAFATAAVLAKPSMGFVYGLLLIMLALGLPRHETRLKLGEFVRGLIPATIIGSLLYTIASIAYGLVPALRLLSPLSGAKMYRTNHFGFWSSGGRTFWYFPGVHIGYYLGTVAAFWFATTLCLAIGGCYAALVLIRRPDESRGLEANYAVVLTCALMHMAFVTLFFGSNSSWSSYAYLLVMGVAAMSLWSDRSARIVAVAALVGLLGQKSMITANYHGWTQTAPSPVTAGLWAPAAEREEWLKVNSLASGHRAVLLAGDGAGQLLFREFQRPVALTLIPGQPADSEIQRALTQLAGTTVAVVPEVIQNRQFLKQWPEFRAALKGWKLVFAGTFFSVYRSG